MGIWRSYSNVPQAIFYLLKGGTIGSWISFRIGSGRPMFVVSVSKPYKLLKGGYNPLYIGDYYKGY